MSIGIRPFVELGFMPYDLASGEETVFWWKGNITPPKDWDRWEWFIRQFVLHVVVRSSFGENILCLKTIHRTNSGINNPPAHGWKLYPSAMGDSAR
ncbi:MAG: hypothetical protein K8L99_13525 [Anaerolineae bacterium]|nr:hypothetical protein [Anaerolineae bacterium]